MTVLSCKENRSKTTNNYVDSLYKTAWDCVETNGHNCDSIFKVCLKLSSENNYQKGKAKATFMLAKAFEKKGKYDSAIAYNFIAYDLFIELNDTFGMVESQIHLAENNSSINQYKIQEKHLINAQSLLNFSKDTIHKLFLNNSFGSYYLNINNIEMALKSFRNANSFFIKLNSNPKYAYTIENIGNVFNINEQADSAIFYYKKCLPYYLLNKSASKLLGLYNNIALTFWQKNQLDSTYFYLSKAHHLAKDFGSKEELEFIITNLIDYWEEQKNISTTNFYLRELINLKDSVFHQNLSSQIANIEKDYTVKLKSEENAKLASELKRKNTLRNASIITALLLALLGLYQFRSYKQKRKILEAEKELKDQEINQLLKTKEVENLEAIIEGREAEQKRIGRDLHDRLGSILSTVKMHFSAIDEKIDALKSENKIQYEKASTLLDEAVSEVRKIAHDLSSGVLVKQGFKAAVVDLINTIESSGKIQVNFYEAGDFKSPNLEFEISLYRIIQELISNILKHANATKIDIHLTQQANQLTLIIEDNGKGFDTQNSASFGIGIANVKQRVAGIGGEITFDSHIGKGCSVIIEINL